jgi:hypothetical protein
MIRKRFFRHRRKPEVDRMLLNLAQAAERQEPEPHDGDRQMTHRRSTGTMNVELIAQDKQPASTPHGAQSSR